MPGVRYGPDISDDAAEIQNSLVELLKLEKKKGKLNARERARLARDLGVAKNLFGVGEARVRKGDWGDLGKLAQYSPNGRDPRTGKMRTRAKQARSKRSGRLMTKDVDAEYEDRARGGKPRSGSSTGRGRGQTGSTRVAEAPASFIGRTKPKGFRDAEERAYRRARRSGVSYGAGKNLKKGGKRDMFKADIDKLNIAQQGGPGGSKRAGYRTGTDLRNRTRSARENLGKSRRDMDRRKNRG